MGPSATIDLYSGFTGPTNFGSGAVMFANIFSGDRVAIDNFSFYIHVPTGYVSGTALLSSSTYNNATFASLGVTPGTYVWSWGTGANQNFTLQIGGATGARVGYKYCPPLPVLRSRVWRKSFPLSSLRLTSLRIALRAETFSRFAS